MSTVHDPRYVKLIEHLVAIREKSGATQVDLAKKLGQEQSFISKVENLDRRIDILELYDWLGALKYPPQSFFREVGWFAEHPETDTGLPALPIPGRARDAKAGVWVQMTWQGEIKEVLLERVTAEQYLAVEKDICAIYAKLNEADTKLKNRDAIYQALALAVDRLPRANPSDIYHHVVYRLYLREYSKTQADRSWVRAGGEAIELFIQQHYNPVLESDGIRLVWLVNAESKKAALHQMGISAKVGGSKLDIAAYGATKDGWVIFGGIHAKASLAERVSDDVPCSEAMIRHGFVSYLFTFDAKSFPPPNGDLVNRGELGSPEAPSDKRNYVEAHGSFDTCFSYNLRTVPSGAKTASGRKILVSSFDAKSDPLPSHLRAAWATFKKAKGLR